MKIRNKILPIVMVAAFSLNSCYDDKMNWGKDPSYGDVTVSEIPLPLQEKISRYETLNKYATFMIGVGIDLSLYMNDEAYSKTINENFNDITVGYDMKHGAMVNSLGELNFTRVDNLIARLKTAGLSVYGHTLVWHQNQNAEYLRKLIRPVQIPPSPGESVLDISGLQDGSFTGWNRANNAAGINIEEGTGLGSADPAIKFSVEKAGNEWDTQLITPDMPAIEGHAYMFTFWIKSESAGNFRVSFANMSNNYPWYDGGALISTGPEWTQISYGADGSLKANSSPIRMAFDMGKTAGTYYIDVNSLKVTDLDAEPTEYNYIENGDFESGDLTSWSALNTGAGIEVTDSEKFAGSYSVKMTSSATSKDPWSLQMESSEIVLTPGKNYTFSFYIKSDIDGKGRVSFPGNANQYPWMNWQGAGTVEAFTTSSTWQLISVDFNNFEYYTGKSNIKLSFDMGYLPDVTYFIDDIKIVEKIETESMELRAGATEIEKTPAEKAEIIGAALDDWMSKMIGRYKNDVHAWDVVNEPMDDGKPLELKSGLGKNPNDFASDEFYWQDYLGKDYAVTAFTLARKYSNPDTKLFINDYNLESNLRKCEGLIEYVKYIESKGAKVDGIGTQMHVDMRTSNNKDNIEQMFQKLGATGKLIKVSELDIRVGTSSPTAAQYEEQADMYRHIIDMYVKHVPASQRYGITVWGISDNDQEHENWIPNDAPNLWNKDYNRKHAYKGFADGLAGKDISADFKGDLIY